MLQALQDFANLLKYLNRARNNLVEAWPKQYYRREFIEINVLGRRNFVINRPEDIQRVMVTNASNYRKSLANRQALKPLLGLGLFVSEGKLWERQRKVMTPALHRNRLADYARTMVAAARQTVDRWSALPSGTTVDLAEEMTLLTSDIITRAMFGEELGERNLELYQAFQDYLASHGRAHISELLGLPSWLPRPGQWRGRAAVRRFDAVIHSVLQQRYESKTEHDDLLQMLIDFQDENGQRMDATLLRDEVASIYLAGHETTAITLTWAFYLLNEHPEIKRRLLDEIERVLGGRYPEFGDIPNLIYTRAVIDETLRLYPPVHVFSRQALGDDTLNGQRIPKGSFITIASWVLHRHKLHWEEPTRFDPDRFLPGNARNIKQFAYIPFGAGPRICLGKHFGLTEAVLLLAIFAQRFDLRLAPNHPVTPLGRMTLRPSHGMPMLVSKRP